MNDRMSLSARCADGAVNRLRRLLPSLIAVAALWSMAPASSISIRERDYRGNYPLTNKTWFHTDANGNFDPEFTGGHYPDIEVSPTYHVPTVVYKRGNDFIDIHVTFQGVVWPAATLVIDEAYLVIDDETTVDLTAAILDPDTGTANASVICLPGEYPEPPTYCVKRLKLFGSPNYVAHAQLWIKAKIVRGGQMLWATTYSTSSPGVYEPLRWEDVCLTYDAPANAMDEPWEELLIPTCDLAEKKTDPGEIAAINTRSVFHSSLFIYNIHELGFPSKFMYTNLLTGDEWFNLTKFFHDHEEANEGQIVVTPVLGNCADVSAFNSMRLDAIGLPNEIHQVASASTFVTNKVCPVGFNYLNEFDYILVAWNMHRQVKADDTIHDACLAFLSDLAGDVYMNCPVEYPWSGYWQTHIDPSYYYGLVRRPFQSPADYSVIDGNYITQYNDASLAATAVAVPTPTTSNIKEVK